jgi:hypothetical protein
MADNIEKDAANTMAGSEKFGGFTKMRNLTNILMGKSRQSGNSGNSGGSTGGAARSGNGWTAEDYKNYGDWQERNSARKVLVREHKNDIQTIRNNEDLLTDIQRQRASRSIAGYGPGNQGGSRQQTTAGGRRATSGAGAAAGRVAGAAVGGAVTKNPRGATVGANVGAKIGDAIENKVVNRKPKA